MEEEKEGKKAATGQIDGRKGPSRATTQLFLRAAPKAQGAGKNVTQSCTPLGAHGFWAALTDLLHCSSPDLGEPWLCGGPEEPNFT